MDIHTAVLWYCNTLAKGQFEKLFPAYEWKAPFDANVIGMQLEAHVMPCNKARILKYLPGKFHILNCSASISRKKGVDGPWLIRCVSYVYRRYGHLFGTDNMTREIMFPSGCAVQVPKGKKLYLNVQSGNQTGNVQGVGAWAVIYYTHQEG